MPFSIIRNDITKVAADAIVNTANPFPVVGSGTDKAVYEAAGRDELLAERRRIGNIKPGDIAVTPAFNLKAKYIIHAVGDYYTDGRHGEIELLSGLYRKSMEKAEELGCSSIAFPLLSTGAYRYPNELAINIALDEINRFLLRSEAELDVILVVFHPKAVLASSAVFRHVESFIDASYVRQKSREEYRCDRMTPGEANALEDAIERIREDMDAQFPEEREDAMYPSGLLSGTAPERKLEDVLKNLGETFSQMVMRLIKEKGLDEVEVYKRANMDRKLFSKIRSNDGYTPAKKTALALAVGLCLNLDETRDLLMKAGYALSPASPQDIIVSYFIERGEYNIMKINVALFDNDVPVL